ncbi:alpha/beta fold hydrolase [Neomegalonema sp.]|uniref:alpha/beta hydrolase n=1 Tax=Neomegalonema sp. TaxID=2039713 RepID=UPI0026101668|nr:alpha/beta fold hydrolase [Neomegalonema sp.]MDD2868913.1 alpha/beta fold hydrolase [Neomegalonema sp.]
MTEAPAFFAAPDGRRLAHVRRAASAAQAGRPGVVFLGGFQSDMTGSKALALDAWALREGRAFLRLDYTGHGASSGLFEEGCLGDWARDALDLFDALTEGPQILVGSSMGGWIGLLLARARPERVAGFLGVAAAPDFTEDLVARRMTAAQHAEMAAQGRVVVRNPHDPERPTVYTRRLIEDGRENLVLRSPLAISGPVRLLQGTADSEVPVSTALALLEHLESPDARLILIRGAGHRLSEPAELALLEETLKEIDALS